MGENKVSDTVTDTLILAGANTMRTRAAVTLEMVEGAASAGDCAQVKLLGNEL